MMRPSFQFVLGALAGLGLPALVSSVASTDSFRDADAPQSGYLPNHNLNPSIVGSDSFKILWDFTSPDARELWLAKPLVYTPDGGSELVITSSEKNIVRVFDSKTGRLIKERTLQPPFSAADSNCGDVPTFIGITGTPIIDSNTGIMYLFSKGYREGTTSGTANGIYKMYAIHIPSLEDAEGFPVLVDGMNADNDPARYFVGGVALQRPALTELNGHIVAGFGSHCGRWNYTGYLMSISKTPGVGVVSMWATEAMPGAPKPQPLELATERGGKAGIWQSGMGLPTIGNRVYFVTGNGQGHENGNIPASGRIPMSTLDESVASVEVSAEGKIRLVDYFQPYDYISLDAGDRDLGSSGLCVLDGSVFRGTGVNRMAVTAGKEGRTYILNADNLGGFRQGPGGGDGVIQTIELGGSVFGGFGSYPHEGGYIYVTTVGGNLRAYKLGHESDGKPIFSLAGTSDFVSAGRVGVGQMTVTSDNGKPGTGIVWVTDVNGGLVAFRAVPEDGKMIPVPLPKTPGTNKYQRPVFGDSKVFVQTTTNRLFCLGSPVAAALTCTSPVDFGDLELGATTSATVRCTANTDISAVRGCTVSNPSFVCSNSTLPTGPLASGSSFSFDVTWDLSDPQTQVNPGFVSSQLALSVSASADFASTAAVSLEGTITYEGPYLHASPSEVPFGRLVLRGDSDLAEGLSATALLENSGSGLLTFTGVAWQDEDGIYTNVTDTGDLGSGFASTNFPAVGSSLASGDSVTIRLNFNADIPGPYFTRVTVWSDGGETTLTLTASVNEPAAVTFEVSDGNGGWKPLAPSYEVNYGDVMEGTSVETQIRICNSGGSPLTITISKPPVAAQLLATNPNHDLTEGQQINPDTCATGTVAVLAGPEQPNHPFQYLSADWTLSTDGVDPATGEASGRHSIVFNAVIVTEQVGPLLEDGSARYQWVGCFQDTTGQGRNLVRQMNNAAQMRTNTLQQCQGLCFDAGFMLSGVQYHQECWCGGPNVKYPNTYRAESLNLCTFDCTGDDTQACGGDGGHMSLYADVTRFDIPAFLESVNATKPTTTTALPGSTSTTSSRSSTSTTSVITTSLTTTAVVTTTSTTSTSTSSSTTITSTSTSSTSTTSTSSTTTVGSTTTTSIQSTASPTSTASPLNPSQPALVAEKWAYAGCFQDLVDGVRTLGGAFSASDDMTPEKCAAFCGTGAWNGGAFNYFGLEYGRECYCGWAAGPELAAPETECPNKCMGLPAGALGLCGGGRRLSVFKNTVPNETPRTPQHVEKAGAYEWLGCYTEATTGRALSGKSYSANDMSVDSCAAFCSAAGFSHMGVEYGRECYCGNAPNAGSVLVDTANCNMLCAGDKLQYCGAGSHLDMYRVAAAETTTTSTTAASTTSVSSTTSTAVPSSTVISSSSTEVSSSSSTVEDSSSTFVSSSSTPSSSSTSTTSSSSPSSSTISTSSIPSSVPATTTTSTSTLSTTTTRTSTGPTPTATDGYYYIGCFKDVQGGDALPPLFANMSVTPELAIAYVNSKAAIAPSPTPRPSYLFIEYHHEVHAGSSFDFKGSAVTSLVGTKACRDYCYGSVKTITATRTVTGADGEETRTTAVVSTTTGTANYCGGPNMFDLYALESTVDFPTTGGPVVTMTAT